jgi:hypothetical protein
MHAILGAKTFPTGSASRAPSAPRIARRGRRSGLAAAVLLAAAGCAELFAAPEGANRSAGAAPVPVACQNPAVPGTVAGEITRLACTDPEDTRGFVSDEPYKSWHFQFDDRAFDPVLASMIVVDCAYLRYDCDQPYAAAQMEYYARDNLPGRVAESLAALGMPDELLSIYVNRYAEARTNVLATIDGLGDYEYVDNVLEVPRAVRQAREAYFKAFADDVAAFGALWPEVAAAVEEGRVDPELRARAEELRDGHVRRCVDESSLSTYFCWYGTFARQLTLALAWMAVNADDPVTAIVEEWAFAYGVDMTSAGAHISVAQEAATVSGADPPGPWTFPRGSDPSLHERVQAMRERVGWARAEVRRVTTRGANATIDFEVQESRNNIDYDCSEARHYLRDDEINPSEDCRLLSWEDVREVTEAVRVPADDAEGLHQGEWVLVVIEPETRHGRVVSALTNLGSGSRPRDDCDRIRFTNGKGDMDLRDRSAAEAVAEGPSLAQ